MEKDVNLLLATYGKYFPEESMLQVRQIFENMDSNQVTTLSMLQFKDPLISLLISFMVGGLGIDRFYIGDTTLGALKLITCSGLGLWYIVDLFLIMGATRQKNLEKLITVL
ncbi:MAG: TM2 domain-containing protein [Prevotella sp.]